VRRLHYLLSGNREACDGNRTPETTLGFDSR
jgi:hypothetical protein